MLLIHSHTKRKSRKPYNVLLPLLKEEGWGEVINQRAFIKLMMKALLILNIKLAYLFLLSNYFQNTAFMYEYRYNIPVNHIDLGSVN